MIDIIRPSVSLEWVTPDALEVIERAGRTCYRSDPRGDPAAFVQRILKRGHESVIEHASASFRIVCDRGVSHEFVRHRIMSFSQESTRYCAYRGKLTVVRPPGLDLSAERLWLSAERLWYNAVDACQRAYDAMLDAGVSPQIARSVLPNCLKTELVATANFREWRHFLKVRYSKAAHPQMVEIAGMIYDWFNRTVPVIVEDIHVPATDA